jgi:hypothetical protein
MTKTLSALAGAAALALVTAAPVQARDCVGCGVAAGAAGPPPPPPPEYVAPVRGPRCWTEPRGPQHWDGYAWVQPTVRVCR